MRILSAVVALAAVLAGGAPRILLAAGTLPESLRPFTWSDPLYTYLRDGGAAPYRDVAYEYPPLTGLAAAALGALATDRLAYVALWSLALAIAAAITAFAMGGSVSGERVLRRWSLAPQLFLLGTLNFDLLACLCLVAAVLRFGEPAALALGIAAKLFPAVAVPAALAHARRPRLWLAVLVLVTAALWLPALVLPHPPQEGAARYAAIGSNLDSPWGIVARTLPLLGVAQAETLVLAVTAAGFLATYALVAVPALRGLGRATGYAVAIACLLLWTRRYSPQYSLWLLPFFTLLPIPTRLYALFALADVAVFLTVSPLTLVPREGDDPESVALLGALVAALGARHAALALTLRSLLRPVR